MASGVWDETATGREPPEEAILILAGRHVWRPSSMVQAAAGYAKAWTPYTERAEAWGALWLRRSNSASFLTQRRKDAKPQGISCSERGLSALLKGRFAPVPQDTIRSSAALRLCGFALSSGCIGMAGRFCGSREFLLPGDRWFRFRLFIPLCIGGQKVSVAGVVLSVGRQDVVLWKALVLVRFDFSTVMRFFFSGAGGLAGASDSISQVGGGGRCVPAARGGLRRAYPLYM
jgi:hypothetical protein